MRLLAVAGVALRRLLRDRSNIFFVFIFPIALIVLIGVSFGGTTAPRLAVSTAAEDPTADRIVAALERGGAVEVVHYEGAGAVGEAVERGWASAGVVFEQGLDAAVTAGDPMSVGFVAGTQGSGPALRSVVEEALAEERTVGRAARFAVDEAGIEPSEAQRRARDLLGAVEGVAVEATRVGAVDELTEEFAGLGRFDVGASGQLLLFVFLVTLTGSAALIQTRHLGVAHRMLATPTPLLTILGGLGLGTFAVAMVQGLYIMIGTWAIFDVNWGDPVAALALLVAFGMVSAGAAMVLGAALDNDSQASGLGVFLGLALAALGGSMMPLELFSPTMRRIAMLTPHAWGIEGYAELIRRGGGLSDVTVQLGVLLAYAAGLVTIGTWLLHRRLTRF